MGGQTAEVPVSAQEDSPASQISSYNMKSTRFKFILAISCLLVPVFLLFALVHLRGGDSLLGYLCLFTGLYIPIALAYTYLKRDSRMMGIRFGMVVIGAMLLYLFSTSGPGGAKAIWLLCYPLVGFFLLGGRGGACYALPVGVIAGLMYLLPGFYPALPRDPGFLLRFFSSYLIISTVSYFFEADRALFFNELTERQKELLEERNALAAAKKRVEESSHAKSRFLASMSHELRTPLNAIIGFAEVLGNNYFGVLNKKQAEYVNDIEKSGKHLLELINEVLDLSKVESGKMELEISTFHAGELLSECLFMIREKARIHSIELVSEIPQTEESLVIRADHRKVKQILFNLLSNAVKFTPDGGRIDTSLRIEGSAVRFTVKDTGMGVKPDEQGQIFDDFYQAGGDRADRPPGTGLGLALARQLVALHGGLLYLESEGLGCGSEFSFTIPRDASKRKGLPKGQAAGHEMQERGTGLY